MKWVPVIDPELCTGCNRCVEACGPKSLEVINAVAVLVRPETCGSEHHCIAPCLYQAIRMEWVEMEGNQAEASGAWKALFEIFAENI